MSTCCSSSPISTATGMSTSTASPRSWAAGSAPSGARPSASPARYRRRDSAPTSTATPARPQRHVPGLSGERQPDQRRAEAGAGLRRVLLGRSKRPGRSSLSSSAGTTSSPRCSSSSERWERKGGPQGRHEWSGRNPDDHDAGAARRRGSAARCAGRPAGLAPEAFTACSASALRQVRRPRRAGRPTPRSTTGPLHRARAAFHRQLSTAPASGSSRRCGRSSPSGLRGVRQADWPGGVARVTRVVASTADIRGVRR